MKLKQGPSGAPLCFLLYPPLLLFCILLYSPIHRMRIFASKKEVNRCLARYSPRATTTNQPTNRAPNEPAMNKNAKFGHFWAKNPNFYLRNQKFCYPHNGKPT